MYEPLLIPLVAASGSYDQKRFVIMVSVSYLNTPHYTLEFQRSITGTLRTMIIKKCNNYWGWLLNSNLISL